MRKIIFLRHGKTESASQDVSDHERKLLPQGVEDAEKVGADMQGLELDLIMVSSAVRASQTAFTVAEVLNYPKDKIAIIENLYNPSLSILLDIVRGIDKEHNTVMVVGHNPGFTECSNILCGVGNISLSTCNYCIIDLDCEWSSIKEKSGHLSLHGKP